MPSSLMLPRGTMPQSMHENNADLGVDVEFAHVPSDKHGQLVHTAENGGWVHLSEKINMCTPKLVAGSPYFEISSGAYA